METMQVAEKWEEYFEQAVANCAGLDEATINELRGDLIAEGHMLDIDEVSDSEKHRRLVDMAERLLTGYQKSAAVAQSVISGLARSTPALSTTSAFSLSNLAALPNVKEPLERLQELMLELLEQGDYQCIREEYCQLSILLNLEGSLAPAFRPALVTGKRFGDRVFKAIHRDQLVIDCHWLHATGQVVTVRAKDVEFKPLFRRSKPFPFDLAWQFANKEWKSNHRVVDMLRLTEFQQCQLKALRGDVVKMRIKNVEHGSRKDGIYIPAPLSIFQQGLNAWCERDRRINKHRDGYLAVWKARSFLGDLATVRQISELVAMILGEAPKDDKTIRSREVNIRRHILGD